MKPLIPTSKADRIARYVDATPGAVSGNNGSGQTLALAHKLIHGFDLSTAESLPYMLRYNQRCDPPWSDAELKHKLDDAAKKTSSKGRGYLLYGTVQRMHTHAPQAPAIAAPARELPNREGFKPGTTDQLRKLATARPYGLEGLVLAQERGLLVFGRKCDCDCYGITDQTGRVLEVRRVDGRLFGALGSLPERKAHAVKNSQKHWPVGILEASQFSAIALVEGIPDFIEAHYLALWEGKNNSVGICAMLSATPAIHAGALQYFKSKKVRLFPHVDRAGIEGAIKWQKQIKQAGAAVCDVFDLSPHKMQDGRQVNDLYDYRNATAAAHVQNNWRVMP